MRDLLSLLKRHEGLRLRAYRCPGGVWTIGWGHTAGVKPGDYVDVDTAESLLRSDAAEALGQVDSLAAGAGVSLSDCQRHALAGFVFNLGIGALRKSALWRRVCADPSDVGIASEFNRWVYAGGKVMPGLVRRRREEANLYFSERK